MAKSRPIRVATALMAAHAERIGNNTGVDSVTDSRPEIIAALRESRIATERMKIGVDKNWPSTREVNRYVALRSLKEVKTLVTNCETALREGAQELPSLRDWLDELSAIGSAFDGWTVGWGDPRNDPEYKKNIDSRHRDYLAITTDSITLKDIELGPFEVRFHWNTVPSGIGNFTVVALKPNPVNGNDAITHPHVKDEALCPGKARDAIRAAVLAGRLIDAFTLINSVLHTYNEDGPFHHLENWHDENDDNDEDEDTYICGVCDESYPGEDSEGYCEQCHHSTCDHCSSYCQRCENSRCSACTDSCEICDDTVCDRESCRPRGVWQETRVLCENCVVVCGQCKTKYACDDDANIEENETVCIDCQEVEANEQAQDAEILFDLWLREIAPATANDRRLGEMRACADLIPDLLTSFEIHPPTRSDHGTIEIAPLRGSECIAFFPAGMVEAELLLPRS